MTIDSFKASFGYYEMTLFYLDFWSSHYGMRAYEMLYFSTPELKYTLWENSKISCRTLLLNGKLFPSTRYKFDVRNKSLTLP